jgi:hypothetical protein
MIAAVPFLAGWSPTTLVLRQDDGVLRVAAPNLHFLEGRTLRRLQDGAGLVFSLQLSLSPDQFRTVTREAAERWMFAHTGLPLHGLAADSSNWVRAELRADDPRDAGGFLLDPTVTLTRLVEWFGRAQRGETERWNMEHGPFRPGDIQR